MQDGYRRVGLIVEHVRAWGRRVCEGVAAAAQGLENWELRMIEPRTTVRTAEFFSERGVICLFLGSSGHNFFAVLGENKLSVVVNQRQIFVVVLYQQTRGQHGDCSEAEEKPAKRIKRHKVRVTPRR